MQMTNNEKSAILKILLLEIKKDTEKPNRLEGSSRSFWSRVRLLNWNYLAHNPAPAFAVFVLMLIFSGGGITYAAYRSLPGQFLYPLKVGFIEEIPAFLAVSSGSKARWETLRASERLQEAENLAIAGELDTAKAQEIQKDFDRHIARVDRWNKKATAEKIQLQDETDTLLVRMNAITKDADLARIKVQVAKADEDVGFAAEATRDSAAAKISQVQNRVAEMNKKDLQNGTLNKVNARLSVAGRVMIEAKAKYAAKSHKDAFVLFQEALTIANEAEALLGNSN